MKEKRSEALFPFTEGLQAYLELRRTHDALHRHVSQKLAQWDLSVPKYGVLVRLYDHGSLPISELSTQIFRGNSNMTTLINRMERDGWVQRLGSECDRRVKKIHLTPQGRKWAPRIIREYRAFLQQAMNCLSKCEQKSFLQCLRKIKETL